MLLLNRVIYSDNGVLTDYSRELSDFNTGAIALTINAAQDAIYIGSDLPFNHRYFLMSAFNNIAGNVDVAIWDGSAFRPAVDVIDLTSSGGAPLAKDGFIMWSTDRSLGWEQASTTEDISELSTLKIYNSYWVKLTFSAAFALTLKYVGHKFASDQDLNAYYSDLNRSTVRDAYFEASTANWNVLHISAAEEIVRDLRARRIVKSVNQIFDPDMFRDCGIHKLAEMVYSSFGPSHADRVDFAVRKYKEALDKLVFNVDENTNGRLDRAEKIANLRLRRM